MKTEPPGKPWPETRTHSQNGGNLPTAKNWFARSIFRCATSTPLKCAQFYLFRPRSAPFLIAPVSGEDFQALSKCPWPPMAIFSAVDTGSEEGHHFFCFNFHALRDGRTNDDGTERERLCFWSAAVSERASSVGEALGKMSFGCSDSGEGEGRGWLTLFGVRGKERDDAGQLSNKVI